MKPRHSRTRASDTPRVQHPGERLRKSDEEIGTLIATLHATSRRLEELTAGEVDTVSDLEGNSFLLLSAQEELRGTEAAKREGILSALPAHIALLDARGTIVSVNAAWRAFGTANLLEDADFSVGANYLDVCDRAVGAADSEAGRVAAGIRAVLAGDSPKFALEYSCPSPQEDRWFLMTVTPLAGGHQQGAVVMHVDISERMAADVRHKGLNRVYAVMSGINALIVRAPSGKELFDEACRIAIDQGEFRMAWIGTVDLDSGDIHPIAFAGESFDFFATPPMPSKGRADVHLGFSGLAVSQKIPVISGDIINDPRTRRPLEMQKRGINSVAAIPLMRGTEAVGVLVLYSVERGFFDEKEIRLLQEMVANVSFALSNFEKAIKLARVTRVNAMLSAVNGAIVRIRAPQELFEEACRIAVETGGLPFAWIGMADLDRKACRPVASAGEMGSHFQIISNRLSLEDGAPGGHGACARAIRGLLPVVINELESDPKVVHRKELLARGVGALAALPIIVAGVAVGAFVLHAAEAGFFDADEMKLLEEMAANIAFALEHIEKEKKVRRLTRVYSVLSGIDSLIVRAVGREQMFQEASRIAVEMGEFRMAWIAIVDKATGVLEPVARAGDHEGFFATSKLAQSHNKPGGLGLPGRAVRERKSMIANDVEHDVHIVRKDELAKRGIRSAAHIPLVISGEAVGVIALYSGETGFFDAEEVRLLEELAGDIAHAIDHIEKQERLDYLAYYDALTGLANRRLFLERVSQYLRSAAYQRRKVAVLLVDIERFKNLNDALGLAAGDAIINQMGEWLMLHFGGAEMVARMGADQFAVVLPALSQEGEAARQLDDALGMLHYHPFTVGEGVYRLAARAGVAVSPQDGEEAETLFKHAEAALKKAKAGGERYLFYAQKMTEMVAVKLTLENQLRLALDREEFVLHYQPKVNLETGLVTGAEALIRWNDPQTGLVPPGRFIPVLEETGLIHDVGSWALRQSVADHIRWLDRGFAPIRIAVNVSPLQLRQRGFAEEIAKLLGADPRAAGGLELEMTETLIMADVSQTIVILQSLRATGVTIAIDDFGTGFSSLSYLARLPVDTLKIDRSFIVAMTTGPEGLALVSTIIKLAQALRLKVVAEGVETEEQSRLLRLLDCTEMQGFLFSKPVPADVFEARFLAAPRPA